jgi:hypothetical protein
MFNVTGSEPVTVWRRLEEEGTTKKVDGVCALLEGMAVVKAELDRSGRYLILLDNAGKLTVWDCRRWANRI